MEGIEDLEEREDLRRRQFEREYLAWLKFSAREIAESLRRLSAERKEEIFAFYERVLREPEKMHSPLSSDERNAWNAFSAVVCVQVRVRLRRLRK